MIDFEGMARQKFSLAVDNTARRQMPLPLPWYERPLYFAALVLAALIGAYTYALFMLSLG